MARTKKLKKKATITSFTGTAKTLGHREHEYQIDDIFKKFEKSPHFEVWKTGSLHLSWIFLDWLENSTGIVPHWSKKTDIVYAINDKIKSIPKYIEHVHKLWE